MGDCDEISGDYLDEFQRENLVKIIVYSDCRHYSLHCLLCCQEPLALGDPAVMYTYTCTIDLDETNGPKAA